MNGVLQNHNVDKQMTDNRGDVAYLMADISNVGPKDIQEIFDNLEDLSCKSNPFMEIFSPNGPSPHTNQSSLLSMYPVNNLR